MKRVLQNRRILITGGCGFIGSALVRYLVGEVGASVFNLDMLTYAGSLSTVDSIANWPNYRFARVDICNAPAVNALIREFQPEGIVHLAAESHVDRSIDGPAEFIRTNVIGTYTLLEAALDYFRLLPQEERDSFRFVHVSTDEVYGALARSDAAFTEESKHQPNSPYSASKASADHLARAWWRTYGLPVIVSNCSNNYGPYQFPEKMIPTMVLSALDGRPLPVYGTGENVRDWLFVDDHVSALAQLLASGSPGGTYLIGGGTELRNIDIVHRICTIVDELRPISAQCPHSQLIRFVADRPGHDLRYAIDTTKIRDELGWHPSTDIDSGLRRTVQWYLDNEAWWRERLAGSAVGERLGLAVSPLSSPCGAALFDRWRIGSGE